MRALAAVLVTAVSAGAAYGQMAKWAMRPGYDSIRLADGVPVVVSDSAGTTSLWNVEGKLMASTADSVAAYSDGLAVTVKRGTDEITGFYAVDGTFTKLDGCNVAYSYPYFRDGSLLVMKQGRCKLVGKDGQDDPFGSFVAMYPYSNGYAACTMYGDMEKLEDLYCYYVDTDRNRVKLKYDQKKEVDDEDVQFLSSLNDDGVGVAIVKRRVYMYDKGLGLLRPVFVDDKAEKKRQVRVESRAEEYIAMQGDTTVVWARGAKKDTVFFMFDAQMRLMCAKYPSRTDTYRRVTAGPLKLKADYAVERRGGLCAVTRGGRTVLPPQFDDSGIGFGRFVAVKSKGKWGLLEMDDKLGYAMSMNKGNPVAFRHQKFETTVRLDLPAEVKADNCSFDIPADKGCAIDKTSIQTRNTVNGNFVQYNCVLTIPDSLPDHIVDVKYPVSVVCDGITYPDGELLVKAWHYKYVNMDLSRNETKFVGNDVEFIINMTAEKVAGENDYPLMVEVLQDSTAARVSLEKLSETRYKCRLYSPMIGVNRVVVKVSEAGCPPSLFPFEINYTKPKASSNAGQVEITAKGKDGSTQTSGAAMPAAQPAVAAPADSTAVTPAAAPAAPADSTAAAPAAAAPADSVAKAG